MPYCSTMSPGVDVVSMLQGGLKRGQQRANFFLSLAGSVSVGRPSSPMAAHVIRPWLLSALLIGLSGCVFVVGVSIASWRQFCRRGKLTAGFKNEDLPSLAAGNDQGRTLALPRVAALLVLGFITVIWGFQQPLIKVVIGSTDMLTAVILNLLRFGLAAACFSAWLPRLRTPQGALALEWRAGCELGFWLTFGFGLHTIGLVYTTAQRGIVLLYLNVQFVSVFAYFFFKMPIQRSVWVSSSITLVGAGLLCWGSGDAMGGVPLNLGDMLCLIAAAASGMFILRLEAFAKVADPTALNAVCTLTVFVMCIAWVLVSALSAGMFLSEVSRRMVGICRSYESIVIHLGAVTTAATNWLQTLAQESVSAPQAAVIYALDGVWGCIFAFLTLGEVLNVWGIIGAGLVIAAAMFQGIATALHTGSG